MLDCTTLNCCIMSRMSSATIINVNGKKNNDVRGHAKEEYFKIPFPVIAIFFLLDIMGTNMNFVFIRNKRK